jgi:WD40 repeat protein
LPPDHYRALGVSESADRAEIKRAYRKLARKLHPDVNRTAGAADAMSGINEAYRVLSDPALRSDYDARIRRGIPEAPPAPRAAGEVRVVHHLSVADLPSPVYSLAFSKSSRRLAAACFDNVIRTLAPANGDPLWEAHVAGGAVGTLTFVGANEIVAAGVSEKTFSTWRAVNGNVVEARSRRVEWVSQIAISPDGKRVAIGGVDQHLAVLDRKSGAQKFATQWHDASITALAFDSAGGLLASGGNDQRIILQESGTGLQFARIEGIGAAPNQIAFSGDDSLIAASLADRSIRVYETRTLMPRKAFWEHESPVESLAFHPSGWLLASADRKGETRLWNALSGRPVACLGGHTAPLKALAFSPNGRYLALGGLDRVVSIWRIEVGEAPPG